MAPDNTPRWTPAHTKLRNILAAVYWDKHDARRLVLDVQAIPLRMQFGDDALVMWHSIIEKARDQGKLDALIAKAAEENPADPLLQAAKADQLGTILMAPEIPQREWRGTSDQSTLEKIMGSASTLRHINFLERGIRVSRSVCRILLGDGSSGTGFLIAPNLIVTNHHVLPTAADAASAKVQFNCQKTIHGTDANIDAYQLDPANGFVTSRRLELGGYDWTIVRLHVQPGNEPHEKWGAISLDRLPTGTPKKNDEAIIIQHPAGAQKQIAMTRNIITYANDEIVQYLTDTMEGSSGSPVFDTEWRIIALHHAGGWLREPGTKVSVFRNQGTHINVIIDGLEKARQEHGL